MMEQLPAHSLRQLRVRAQGLRAAEGAGRTDVAGLVRALCAVQAQEAHSAALALRARGTGLTAAQVEAGRVEARAFVRTWAMRGTLHWVATADLAWVLAALAPRILRTSRRRYGQLGLTEAVLDGASRALQAILSKRGPLTRAGLAAQLAARGFPTEGQAAYHLIRHAGLLGLVCFGPDRDGEPTFTLLEDWAPIGDAATAENGQPDLARRYLSGHGPAGPEDFASWSGLTLTRARAAFAALGDELQEVHTDGATMSVLREQTAWLDAPEATTRSVRLLPAYDPYLLGYRDRDLIVAREHARRIHPGGGVIRPTVVVDGRAAATWQIRKRSGRIEVQVDPFEPLEDSLLPALEGETRDVGRFLETGATLRLKS